MTAVGRALLAAIALTFAAPALAHRSPAPRDEATALQDEDQDQTSQQQPDPKPTALAPVEAGHVARSAVGRAGQRQTRGDAAPNVAPMSRITSRINNRVQSRIRNRIDEYYDPQANAASPFEVAGDQARSAATRTR